jgi:hypothetical protein
MNTNDQAKRLLLGQSCLSCYYGKTIKTGDIGEHDEDVTITFCTYAGIETASGPCETYLRRATAPLQTKQDDGPYMVRW